MLLFVDNLTNVDFSYLHADRGLLGETWLASACLEGQLDEQGMICDFGQVKKLLRHFLDFELDHKLLVPSLSKQLSMTEANGEISLNWQYGNGQSLYCRSPAQAIALIDAEQITAQSVASWCIRQLQGQFASSVQQLEISFADEPIEQAFYHYSHGLKKHAGNCQRIAHGHRSRIEIWRNGNRDKLLEADWAKRWADIYLGSREDLRGEGNQFEFAYQSAQGEFEIHLPAASCYMLETDTTVEWLADHIAQTLAAENPGQTIRVKAFEGLQKGAIAEVTCP